MRFKYLFLGLMLLILAGSMTAIAAADDYESLGDYTFDIPDGYQVKMLSNQEALMSLHTATLTWKIKDFSMSAMMEKELLF